MAQPPGDFEPVQTGQHHIEDDDVKRVGAAEVQTFRPIAGEGDGVPFLLKPFAEQARHFPVVLNEQNAHVDQSLAGDKHAGAA